MTIDGKFLDWSDADPGQPLTARTDGRTLWIQLRLGATPVSLQNLSAPWTMDIELDDDPSRTQRIVFSPESTGRGVHAEWIDGGVAVPHSPYDIHFLFAPTIAASRFELSLRLAEPSGGIVRLDTGEGRPVLTTTFDASVLPVSRPPAAAWPEKPPVESIRVVSWNILFGNILHKREQAAPLLAAMQPDILLLQELEDDQAPETIAEMLDDVLGTEGGRWQVASSPVGSGLRSMVAARGGIQLPEAARIPRLDAPDRFLKAAALGVPIEGRGLLLATSVHLRCCGGPGEEADLQRIAEAISLGHVVDGIIEEREIERRQLATAIGRGGPAPSNGIAGLIIGGDLNLVGTRAPLTILSNRRAGFGEADESTDLVVADPMHVDGTSNATWSDSQSSFTPGRLDYLLYSPATLTATNAFILDTARIDPADLLRRSIAAKDTSDISDHAPLVLDLVFKER
tara:strand:- start:13606 stop:14973 length:1368 start_codon:yes stop_codon:yes gene_type:complete